MRTSNRKLRRTLKAGEAIASGTYGCVFYPGLACEGASRQPNTVSKLMSEENANEEYDESALVRVAASTLGPLTRDMFILPMQAPCVPARLALTDLKGVRDVCPKFRDINTTRADLRILTQEYGGIALNTIDLDRADHRTFARITSGLIDLLYAVRQLNLRGVLHGDVKAANVVFNPADGKVRLIDWGFVRSVHVEYAGKFWDDYDFPVFMFNCVPSFSTYGLFFQRRAKGNVVEAVYDGLLMFAEQNKFHLKIMGNVIDACVSAQALCATLLGKTQVVYPVFKDTAGDDLDAITFADGTSLSLNATNVLVAHGVAFLQAVKARGRDMVEQTAAVFMLIDLVLRANLDVYGILMCYESLSTKVSSKRHTLVLGTLAPYLIDPKYAVTPYDIDEIAADLRQLTAVPGVECPPQARAVDFSVPVLSVSAMEAIVDPGRLRAFPSEVYVSAMRAKDEIILSVEQQGEAILAAASGKRPLAPAPAAAPAGDQDAVVMGGPARKPRLTRPYTSDLTGGSFLSGGAVLSLTQNVMHKE
jgi:hypothetical protein